MLRASWTAPAGEASRIVPFVTLSVVEVGSLLKDVNCRGDVLTVVDVRPGCSHGAVYRCPHELQPVHSTPAEKNTGWRVVAKIRLVQACRAHPDYWSRSLEHVKLQWHVRYVSRVTRDDCSTDGIDSRCCTPARRKSSSVAFLPE